MNKFITWEGELMTPQVKNYVDQIDTVQIIEPNRIAK